jgi:hypothetical protein
MEAEFLSCIEYVDRELNGDGIKVSHGSISNIINAYKRKHEQSPQLQPSPPQKQQEQETTSSPTTLNIVHAIIGDTGSPSSNPGDGPKPDKPHPKTSGGPLLRFVIDSDSTNRTIMTAANEHPIPKVIANANLANPMEADEDTIETDSHSQPPAFPGPEDLPNERKPERPSLSSPSPKTEEIEKVTTEENELSTPDSEDNEPVADDWDPDQEYRTRFFRAIIDERKQRQSVNSTQDLPAQSREAEYCPGDAKY